MQWRKATATDIPRLGAMSASLIENEGHQNPMNIRQAGSANA